MERNKPIVWIIVGLIVAVVIAVWITNAKGQTDPAYSETWGTTYAGVVLQPVVVANPVPGDVNLDGQLTAADIVAIQNLMKYAYTGDVDGNNKVDFDDVAYMTEFIFSNGDPPKERTRCRSVSIRTPCWYEGAPAQ